MSVHNPQNTVQNNLTDIVNVAKAALQDPAGECAKLFENHKGLDFLNLYAGNKKLLRINDKSPRGTKLSADYQGITSQNSTETVKWAEL